MSVFPHHELRYYLFGLRAGLANLRVNGLGLGAKKTLGKILQPINSYTRFPEYYWFDQAIRRAISQPDAQILDVGSPKALGLYLGVTTPAALVLTDISEINVDEYRVMWRALERRAKGSASFLLQDARRLQFQDSRFHVVYSMSVLEHIEGDSGDSSALRELVRVLKPGGLLAVSVPFGNAYVEQRRIGFAGAARRTGDAQSYFFQRIYDAEALRRRILNPLDALDNFQITTVLRTRPSLARMLGGLSENLRGLLGPLNPWLSVLGNRSVAGIAPDVPSDYGEMHKARDIYGDVIITATKR